MLITQIRQDGTQIHQDVVCMLCSPRSSRKGPLLKDETSASYRAGKRSWGARNVGQQRHAISRKALAVAAVLAVTSANPIEGRCLLP